jgi:hypothetical protein
MTKKPRNASKLSLDQTTVRVLTHAQLDSVHGGTVIVAAEDAKKTTWTRTGRCFTSGSN